MTFWRSGNTKLYADATSQLDQEIIERLRIKNLQVVTNPQDYANGFWFHYDWYFPNLWF
jgi:hypothetical protein